MAPGPFDRFERAAESWLGVAPSVTDAIVATATVVAVYVASGRVGRRLVAALVADQARRFQLNKAVGYALGTISFFVVLKIWFNGITGLATYFGLLSAGLAIALQDPVANFAGWIYVVARRPFGLGDRVQIGPNIGDVVDIRPFCFVLLEVGNWVKADQSTGRVIHVPNAMVFKTPVANYDEAFGYIWNELDVTVTMESNWKVAKAILLRLVNAHSESVAPDAARRMRLAADSLHIKFGKLTPVVWTTLDESGIRLTARYLCKPRERRSSASAVCEELLDELAGLPDVDLAYPTTRWFDNALEGKPGARSEKP